MKAVGANGETPGTDQLDAGAVRVNPSVKTISDAWFWNLQHGVGGFVWFCGGKGGRFEVFGGLMVLEECLVYSKRLERRRLDGV